MSRRAVLLVVAKAPVPGLAKTRLCPPATPEQSANIAAASLLDTVDAALSTPDTTVAVAFTGDLHRAARSAQVDSALARCTVFPQRGDGLAERLANAHADVAQRFPGIPVLQIGMDTPQVTPQLLHACIRRLWVERSVLGLATDGGWWALGLQDPLRASALLDVPMSTSDTGLLTYRALIEPALLPELSDVDTMADARRVATEVPGSRFAAAVAKVPVRVSA
ncbi:DUF2064 domain-containing protein [Pseudonocardiaceae bacterium YIM PH 21723]|nr:DUF2064 domain-containing protein [Pseudonocardiaceae bacterium YIM PH 21723]